MRYAMPQLLISYWYSHRWILDCGGRMHFATNWLSLKYLRDRFVISECLLIGKMHPLLWSFTSTIYLYLHLFFLEACKILIREYKDIADFFYQWTLTPKRNQVYLIIVYINSRILLEFFNQFFFYQNNWKERGQKFEIIFLIILYINFIWEIYLLKYSKIEYSIHQFLKYKKKGLKKKLIFIFNHVFVKYEIFLWWTNTIKNI